MRDTKRDVSPVKTPWTLARGIKGKQVERSEIVVISSDEEKDLTSDAPIIIPDSDDDEDISVFNAPSRQTMRARVAAKDSTATAKDSIATPKDSTVTSIDGGVRSVPDSGKGQNSSKTEHKRPGRPPKRKTSDSFNISDEPVVLPKRKTTKRKVRSEDEDYVEDTPAPKKLDAFALGSNDRTKLVAPGTIRGSLLYFNICRMPVPRPSTSLPNSPHDPFFDSLAVQNMLKKVFVKPNKEKRYQAMEFIYPGLKDMFDANEQKMTGTASVQGPAANVASEQLEDDRMELDE